jgi:hypothetical protein
LAISGFFTCFFGNLSRPGRPENAPAQGVH